MKWIVGVIQGELDAVISVLVVSISFMAICHQLAEGQALSTEQAAC